MSTIRQGIMVLGLSLAAGLATEALAISNIEDQRPGPPKPGFSGKLELSIAGKTGDKKERDGAVATKLNYRLDDDILLFIGSAEYGSTRGVKDSDEAFAHVRWMHLFSERFASEAFVQWEEDEFSNLSSRILGGGGGRWVVASEIDTYSLALGLGAFREIEKLDLQTITDESRVWRINSYYAYSHVFNEKTSIASTTYVQPNAEEFDDLRVLFTFHLIVRMTEKLALKLSYQAKYDSEPAQNLAAVPPIDNNKTNTEYTTSLEYRF